MADERGCRDLSARELHKKLYLVAADRVQLAPAECVCGKFAAVVRMLVQVQDVLPVDLLDPHQLTVHSQRCAAPSGWRQPAHRPPPGCCIRKSLSGWCRRCRAAP